MEQYLEDADTIFKDYKNRITDENFKILTPEERLSFYQKKYSEFTMSFPIVIRYLIQFGMYKQKAFSKYIKKLQNKPYKSEQEYCERQADYVKFLYMETNKHYNQTDIKELWTEVYNSLIKEVELFKQAEETVKQRHEKNNTVNADERRKELMKMI